MQAYFSILIPLIYTLATLPYAGLGLYAWRHRPAVAVTPFAWMMVGMAIWSFAYSLEIFLPGLAAKLILVDIEYLGVATLPTLLLAFALEYTGRGHLLAPRNKILFALFPLSIIILVWTNELHHGMWDFAFVENSSGLMLLNVERGPFYWINVAYSYILLLISTMLLIMEFLQRPGIYRFQVSLVMLGLFSPWIGNIIYLTNLSPIPNLDPTPLFFIPTSLALGWAITRYRLLDVLPLEHIAILQNMRDGVIVLDSQLRFLYMNPIAEVLIGHTQVNSIGQPLAHISSIHSQAIAPYLAEKEQRFETSFDKSENAQIFDVTVSPMSALQTSSPQSGSNYLIIFHDITGRKEVESLLSRREAIMEAISLAAEQFLRESSWEHSIPGVLEKIGQAADVSRVYVFMNYTDENGMVHSSQCYEWVASGISSQINNPALQHIHIREAGFGRWEEILGKGQPLFGHLRDFPESEKEFLGDLQIYSLAVMPIFVERAWWGFIGFDECRRERIWTETELEALHATASIFGSAETRARAEQRLLRRQRTLNALHEIVALALMAPDLQSMSQGVVERMGDLLKATGCFLSLWDETTRQVIPLSAFGMHGEKFLSSRPASGESTLTSTALNSKQALVIEDTKNSHFHHYNFLKNFPSKSIIVFPLIAGENRLGAIILTFDRQHQFQPEEISNGEQASGLIALSLEKFQAVEHARRRAEEAETLRKAGAAITETLHAEEAVTLILEQLAQVIPYDSASVQLLDGNELEIVGGRGWKNPSDVVGIRFRIPGDNPNSVVIETEKPYLLSDAREKYAAFRNPPHDHIRSWLGVPLIVRNKTIGLLAIDSMNPGHFTSDNINLAMGFADQVAIALENTRLFEEVQSLALTDPLTGLYNRRGLFELGRVELARSIRSDRPFSAIMIDLDHFKLINDTYGHSTGDLVLREFANRCRNCVRDIDFVGRYGGEEIIILLPETNMTASMVIAERLRIVLGGNPIRVDAGRELNVTASLGVAHRDDNTTDLETLIARADQAMYVAKHKGRNRVATSV